MSVTMRNKIANLIWLLCTELGHPVNPVDCPISDCEVCGVIACPEGDPSHFSSEGCPSEDFEDEIEV